MNEILKTNGIQPSRTIWIDALKGFLIIVVVLGHALQLTLGEDCFDNHLLNIICSFQMPVFVAVSGYLNYRISKRPLFDRLQRRALQLIVPFFIWSLLQFIIDRNYSLPNLYSIVLFPDGYFWFLWTLFFIYLIFNLAEGVSTRFKIKQELVMVVVCLLLSAIMVVFEFRYFGFQFIAYYFLFYVIGYYINKYKKILDVPIIIALLLFVFWLFLAWNWRIDVAPSIITIIPLPSAVLLYSYKFFVGLFATYIAIVFFSKIKNGKGFVKLLANCGELSLGIYVFHRLTMKYLLHLLKNVIPNCPDYLMVLLLFIISVILSYFVVRLLNKYQFTSKYLLGKV